MITDLILQIVPTTSDFPYGPVATMLLMMGYIIAGFLTFMLIFLHWRVDKDFPKYIYGAIIVLIYAFYSFAAGGLQFSFPFPGAIWLIALCVIIWASGVAFGFLVWGLNVDMVEHLTDEIEES